MQQKFLSVNDAPKWFKAVLLLFPLIGIAIIGNGFHNDLYFLIPTGDYIVHHGFPHTDILSMHTGMEVVIQQWLSCVIFYAVHTVLGNAGIAALVYLCYLLLIAAVYKLCSAICKNFAVSALFTAVICLLVAVIYETARPQIFTYLIILAEVICLEKFVQTKKICHLCWIPLLSVLLVNLHAAMWALLFVFAAPYAAAALPIKLGKIKQEPCCSFVKLLVCGIVTFAVGFLNPYGWGSMSYVLTSFGYSEINGHIYEMSPTTLTEGAGTVFLAVLCVLLVIAVVKKERCFSTRFVLLFAGTCVLALFNIKSVAYYLIAGVPAFTYLLQNADVRLPMPDTQEKKPTNKKRVAVLSVLLVAVACLGGFVLMQQQKAEPDGAVEQKSAYAYMDEMIDIMEQSGEEITLYAGFDWGQYLEYKGYHPYIDGRAELFLKDNNGEFNYLDEYNKVVAGVIYHQDFVDKYHFNYLIVSDREPCLRMALLHDDRYEALINSEEITLFRVKDKG